MKRILNEYLFGDMKARYEIDSQKHVGLMLYPAELLVQENPDKKAALDPLVQIKLTGDIYNGAYAPGNTMRNGETVYRFRFDGQQVTQENDSLTVMTCLKDDRGYVVRHYLIWESGTQFLRSYSTFENKSGVPAVLEMFSSFSLHGISPYLEGDGHNQIDVHRLRSRWSEEGKWETRTMEELQLETSWTMEAVRCERFGQVGSMPVSHYFPFLAMEDKKNHVFWGMQIAHNASWQMEIYRIDQNIAVSGGLADREFGHWMKKVEQGETFVSPTAVLTVCKNESFDEMTARLVQAGVRAVEAGPETEQELPIVFNEYCTTWGCPSHENIQHILEAIKDKGFTYFVIDCGWYKADGIPWDTSMGDYEVSAALFPEGLEKTVEAIKKAGMLPGLWFEIENVGFHSKAFHEEEHLLHRDGMVLTTNRRRFWNMNDPWVEQYLTEKVIGTLKKYGFSYMKIDYNDEIGIGCDGAESLGEGLRKNMEAASKFLEKVKKEIPGIVLENCASGGHRLEPKFMGQTSMASFSDAHECLEIPIIAANLHRAILPRQSQIWAVIRKEDSLKRIAYSICATFLGRMCISGDVMELTKEQWDVIDRGIAFYKRIAAIIKDGRSYRFGSEIASVRHPEGWQAVYRRGTYGGAYLVLHQFQGTLPQQIEITLPDGEQWEAFEVYSDAEEEIEAENGVITYIPKETDKALAVRFY